MKITTLLTFLALSLLILSSCVSKKKFKSLEEQNQMTKNELFQANAELDDCVKKSLTNKQTIASLNADYSKLRSELDLREEIDGDLREQIADLKKLRDSQITQVGDLTVLSKSANDNISNTLRQLEKKDKYITLLQQAKTKADSINLALSVNLKKNLSQGIDDQDIEVKIDKTVVFINLSDKMLYQSGSAKLTSKANEVLAKIATILNERPDLEVMVEGYTDNQPINTECIEDNWDLSVKRSTAVVRVLQRSYNINPNRLIAAGRGQYNALADNSTSEGRSMNRRTRIIIMPKLDEFYELLNPNNIPE